MFKIELVKHDSKFAYGVNVNGEFYNADFIDYPLFLLFVYTYEEIWTSCFNNLKWIDGIYFPLANWLRLMKKTHHEMGMELNRCSI